MATVSTLALLSRNTSLLRQKCGLHFAPARKAVVDQIFKTRRNLSPFLNHKVEKNVMWTRCILVRCSSDYNDKYKENPLKTPVKAGLIQRFKQMYRDYWYVLVPVHLVTSAAWFGGFYYLASSGIDIVALMESWNISDKIVNPFRDSSMGYIAVSYALYKIATPLRYTVTLGGTTVSIKYLKEWGYIKPVPSTQELKDMYTEKRDNLRESMKQKQEQYAQQKGNLFDSMREKKEEIKQQTDVLKDKKDMLMKDLEHSIRQISDKKKILSEKGPSTHPIIHHHGDKTIKKDKN